MNVRYSKLATADEVERQIGSIAAAIPHDEPERSPLFVALLRGAAPFSSRLMSEIARQSPDYHPEIDYMMVSTYGAERHASEPHIVTDLAPSTKVNGRDVIIIDDVLDKGVTADFVTRHVQARGAAAVKLAVLCDKRTARERDVKADYIGFTFDDNWLVGMGMDDASVADEGYRWLDEIWEIKR
jgi:hypoxanthine phosphoribosyltransferase